MGILQKVTRCKSSGSRWHSDWVYGFILTLTLVTLSFTNHFLLFHTLVEFLAITVGVAIYLIARNSYSFTRNGFLLFLAQGFFWAACIDAIHTLSYKGIGLLDSGNPNLATQLWLCARFLEASVLLLAPTFLNRRVVPEWSFTAMAVYTAIAGMLIYFGLFPDAYIPGQGLTPFKIHSEYFIIAVLLLAAWRLHARRDTLSAELYHTILAVIVLTVISEFSFTLYVDVYGLSNLIGHIAKLWAFGVLLIAIARWMLARPFRSLSREANSFENIPLPVLMLDDSGVIQACNHAAKNRADHCGLGVHIHDSWHPREMTMSECPVCRAIASGQAVRSELRDEGRDSWASVSLQPVQQNGSIQGFVCVHEDITVRKRSEEAQLATDARLQTILDGAPDGVFLVDRDGRISYVNKHSEMLVGYTKDALLQMSVFDLTPEDELERAGRTLQETFSQGKGRVEIDVLCKDGKRLPVEITGVLLPDGLLYASMRDISERMQAARKLMEQGALLRRIIDSVPDLIFFKDSNSVYLGCNSAFEHYFGCKESEIVGKSDFDFVDKVTAEFYRENDRKMLEQGDARVNEEAITYPDGKVALMETLKTPYYDDEGGVLGLIGISRDITERRRVEEEAAANAKQFQSLFENMMEGFAHCKIIYDDSKPVDFVFLDVNEKFSLLTGLSDVVGKRVSYVVPTLFESNWEMMECFARVARSSEPERFESYVPFLNSWFSISVYSFEKEHFVVLFDNITERKNYESQLEHQANYDPLTNLANRNLLNDRLGQSMVYARRSGRQVAVMLFDLDRFKIVNDSLGHDSGDILLKHVAQRLSSSVREGDTVARIGGDEFVVVMSDMASENDALGLAKKLLSAIEYPIEIDDRKIVVTTSIGVTLYPRDGDTSAALLKNADMAMYRAKEMGGNRFSFYSPELDEHVVGRLELEQQLRRALEVDEFEIYYQPQVLMRQAQLVGAEALIRWNHPELGVVGPAEFIPLAEETGLIVNIGNWVLDGVCSQIRQWKEAGLPEIKIAVNVSARQFQHEKLVDVVKASLRKHMINPSQLEIEVTESVVMEDPEHTASILRELKRIGVSIALDDFGTGYSSLSYLKRFPIDQLKIDQSFVRDITIDPDDAAIALSVISLAHSLKREVLAEGVENEAQLGFLQRHGCDLVQGYLFSRPLPVSEFSTLLSQKEPFSHTLSGMKDIPRTVLLVDDEPIVLDVLEANLLRDGYRILKARNADEGLELLAVNDVQVVISDQRMPEMTGIEFLSRVKELYPDTVRIILTGYSDAETVTNAVNKGVIYKFMTKPWDENEIRENVREAFRYYSAIRVDFAETTYH